MGVKESTDPLYCQGAPGDLAGDLLGEPVSGTPLAVGVLGPIVHLSL